MEFDLLNWLNGLSAQDWKLFGMILLGCFILVFILGMTNRVVIFQDVTDFMWTMGIVLSPIIGFIVLLVIAPENTPDGYNIFWTTGSEKVVSVTTAGCFIGSVVMTYVNSIKSNGIALGIGIGTFRVVASMIIALMIVGIFNKLFEKNNPPAALFLVLIFTAIFGFVIKRLINGERVMERRMATA